MKPAQSNCGRIGAATKKNRLGMYHLKTRCSAAISSVRQCETSATKTFLPQNKKPPQIYIYIYLHQIDQTG